MGKTPMLIEGKEVELEKTPDDEKEPEQGAKDSPAEAQSGTKSGKLEEDGKKYVNDFLADYADQVFQISCSKTTSELICLLGADVLVTSHVKLSGSYLGGFHYSCAMSVPESVAQDFLKKYFGLEVVQSDLYESLRGEVPLDKLVSQVPELEEVKKIMVGRYHSDFHPYVAVLGLPRDLRWLPAVAIGGRGIKEFTSFSWKSDQSKESLKNLFQEICTPSGRELFSAAFAYGVKEIMPVRNALNKVLEEYVGMLK